MSTFTKTALAATLALATVAGTAVTSASAAPRHQARNQPVATVLDPLAYGAYAAATAPLAFTPLAVQNPYNAWAYTGHFGRADAARFDPAKGDVSDY
ncbi:hypothetical protein A33M_2689 [Rhodovulum sp. PH10]|uniref:hypothetical protein n=1 Tax=Rhodovulum sp. PH10 TaxID=1187851 RepID=UPI00027C2385|nr:hypothetical protein [Rhodovulum sp. PH10]EJW11908.1 hypothetical protein A33M_2689 [Rhodovulum sp. PH10]